MFSAETMASPIDPTLKAFNNASFTAGNAASASRRSRRGVPSCAPSSKASSTTRAADSSMARVSTAAIVKATSAATKSRSNAPVSSVKTCATRFSEGRHLLPTRSVIVNVTGTPGAGSPSRPYTRPRTATPCAVTVATGTSIGASTPPRGSATPCNRSR